MDKIKLLTISVIVLLVINIATLLFLVQTVGVGPQERRPKPRPDKMIIDKLHFNKKQQKDYRKLIHWHRTKIDVLDSEIQHTKHELYLQLLKSDVDEKAKNSLIDTISNIQKQIEYTHFKHFQDIKKLCEKDQLQDFEELTEDLTQIFNHPPKPKD